MNDKTTQEWWQLRYRDDWEVHKVAWQNAISKTNSGENNPMFGRRDQMHGLQKFVSGTLGKTVEEIHGEEKGRAIRALKSVQTRGELNPAFGKVYARGGRSVKGHYKSFFFRSLLEYSFMKHLERRGFDLARDVRYERFRVPYIFEEHKRTYTVDFHVVPEKIVYEVKPCYIAAKPPTEQLAKWEAARIWLADQGLEFRVVTEDDFEKLLFKDVYGVDTEVEWDERTFEYFKKS